MTNWTDRPETAGVSAGSGMRQDGPQNDVGAAKERLRHEADEATRLAQAGGAAIKRKAAQLAEGAKAELEDRGEDAKSRTTQGLDAFAKAMRSAHDDLARDNPGILSQLVGEAATSLEEASGGLRRTSAGDLVEAARDFGRRNPVGFIAASVLAGFAAARFVGSSAPRSRPGGTSEGTSSGRGSGVDGRAGSYGQQASYGKSATTRGAL